MSPNDDTIYEVSLDQGFPAFYTFNRNNDGTFSDTYSDDTLFDFFFYTFDESLVMNKIDAIPCSEAVPKYIHDERT